MHKYILVCGGSGFIGTHLIRKLVNEGHKVVSVDISNPEHLENHNFEFIQGDLRDYSICTEILKKGPFDEIYQLAADMGGAGYIFTGESDADIISNSALININLLRACVAFDSKKIFYSSSACIYPQHNQLDPLNPYCEESSAYPADPDSEYGWEKLFSERLYFSYHKNYNIDVKVARFHNVYGPFGAWNNGKEKAPSAICRKVAEATNPGAIEIWGDGNQTRTFLYIDDCLDGIEKFMNSIFHGPYNIGSEELISINDMARMAMGISGKELKFEYIEGPMGVRGRSSHNLKVSNDLGWQPRTSLREGLEKTFNWINDQVQKGVLQTK
ncbi:NAD-dependent epimerase/dehydratase family protein [Marinoscillum sp.]|uniref:NAD-dependent epimerase/dehydratase family protein n=1 Tax=Marinoscillum sp. TaxID=2024838 RepID=UPI003BAA934A